MSTRPYRLGRRAETAAATRQRILRAGWIEIELRGYRPASIEAIAARAEVTRVTVYRHFASRGDLLEAIAWDRIGRVRLERLDAARAHPDVVEATRLFLHENCLFFGEVGGILRAMIDVEREEPELAAVLALTYRGRRLESIRHLAERIAASDQVAPGWTASEIADALAILTGIETFEALTTRPPRTPESAADLLFSMSRAFLLRPAPPRARVSRGTSREHRRR
jgi:AcrR family transcriptional regulator